MDFFLSVQLHFTINLLFLSLLTELLFRKEYYENTLCVPSLYSCQNSYPVTLIRTLS